MPWKRRVSRRRLSSFHMFASAALVQPSATMLFSISSLRGPSNSGCSARRVSAWVMVWNNTRMTVNVALERMDVNADGAVRTLDEVWIAAKLIDHGTCRLPACRSMPHPALPQTSGVPRLWAEGIARHVQCHASPCCRTARQSCRHANECRQPMRATRPTHGFIKRGMRRRTTTVFMTSTAKLTTRVRYPSLRPAKWS